MERIIKLLTLSFVMFNLFGCQKDISAVKKDLELKEMRSIAELATVECYYHNVAKSDEPTNKSFFEFWKKNNIRFWVEYDGIVQIGIDATKLQVSVDGSQVKISLPTAHVLNAKVNPDSLSKNSFYYDPNSEKPNEASEREAFNQAQQNMKLAAESNTALLSNARENAKELLENYVNTIGEATGIKYNIEWIYLED